MTNFMPQSDSRNDPAFKSLEASRLGPADQKRLTFTDINDWVNITLKQHFRKDVKKVIDFITYYFCYAHIYDNVTDYII